MILVTLIIVFSAYDFGYRKGRKKYLFLNKHNSKLIKTQQEFIKMFSETNEKLFDKFYRFENIVRKYTSDKQYKDIFKEFNEGQSDET